MIDFALAQQQSPHAGSSASALLVQLIFFIVLLGIFYFLLIRPQQRARKQHEEFLSKLKKGDKVITSAGIWGTIVELDENKAVLKVDANTRITITKSAIIQLQPNQEGKND
ncbi:MAG: preprotein translocase subunit YajC [Aquificaceae bacterium]|nr:preprotein translocase subunit YajC [Aquificaceae bacterium]MDW8237229.1 preprotein translocase subunit YajC [Aquificaceae bacterium]